jgi:heat shock protein HslJ
VGALSANAGCNSIAGTYAIDGGRLAFDSAGMTEMGCDAERHAQDDWLAAFLASKPAVSLVDSDLTLDNGAISIRLLDREVADPDLNIVGPTWTVETIIAGDAASSVPDGATATIVFKADGSFDIDAGCNRGSGRWALEGSGIAISAVGLTKMACDKVRGELEAAVLRVIGTGTLLADIEADVLTLSRDGWGLQLRG